MAGRCARRPRGILLLLVEKGRSWLGWSWVAPASPPRVVFQLEGKRNTLLDRHTAFHVCRRWAAAVSNSAIWRTTEIWCTTEDMAKGCVLQCLPQFVHHIRHLKIVLDQSQELYRRFAAQILHMLNWQSHQLKALCIEFHGESPTFYSAFGDSPYFYSGQDILENFRRLCKNTGKTDLHFIDFRLTPFPMDHGMVRMIATSNPNLHTLLINNHPSRVTTVLRSQIIVEVLRICPKLSTLGVYHALLSGDVFRELLKPDREPFLYLDLYCEGLNHYIPEDLWSVLTEKHPQLRVGLEFALTVPTWKMTRFLKPNIPIAALQFNTLMYMARQIRYVADNYHRTLERLVLDTTPSDDFNLSLIELANKCVHLKEIHCYCVVSQAVIDAFLLNCPGLISYTLSTR
ncbi:F-box/LRR-repeat protein 8-like isoform X3 [Hemicordylus capensis]|uniref:F-box/LRR-repeat protein 8-like isoform X3 n=1 Tax=Hemicordylus capensis TaxID=884348 RepID=UPI002303505F|nr:F-box/LRR-repeat protein 8-like isoform X3 [Hemicordylus capensis]